MKTITTTAVATAAMVQKGDEYQSISDARTAIKAWVLDEGLSFKTLKSDKYRYTIGSKDTACLFRIHASASTKQVVSITTL
jgi:hypothetical protein